MHKRNYRFAVFKFKKKKNSQSVQEFNKQEWKLQLHVLDFYIPSYTVAIYNKTNCENLVVLALIVSEI